MQLPENIRQYLETVGNQIRWKKARSVILEELENHILDQKSAFMSNGCDDESAERKSIAEMGDPIGVGEALDRTHRPKADWRLMAITGVILCAGLVFQFLAASFPYYTESFTRQLMWAGIAIVVMIGAYFIDFSIIGRYPRIIFFSLGVVTILCGISGGIVNGSFRFALYPLLLYPVAYAGFIHSMRGRGYVGLTLCGLAFLLPALLALWKPSLTVLALLCMTCFFTLTGAILKGMFNVRKALAVGILFFVAAALTSIAILIILQSNRSYALSGFINLIFPGQEPTDKSYTGTVIHEILTQAKLIGEGRPITEGQPLPFLPEAGTSFILVYLIFKFGWIVLLGIASIFLAFIIRSVRLGSKQQSNLGFLVSRSIVFTITVECFLYIATNLGFLLFAPLSLPLISYGGGGLVINMFLIGLLLSVYRTGGLVKDKVQSPHQSSNRFIQYEDGSIIISLRNKASKQGLKP